MSQPDVTIATAAAAGRRLLAAGRRVAAAPEWPASAALLLGLLAMVEVTLGAHRSDSTVPFALLLALAATVPLAVVRTHLVVAAATLAVANALALAMSGRLTVAGLVAQVVVLYLVGARHTRWIAGPLLLPFVGYAVAGPLWRADETGAAGERLGAVLLLALVTVALGTGVARRLRRRAAERAADRRMIADTMLEHVARGERARIARELHDVVAHHISMIAVQAETARLTTPGMPVEGARRLVAIAETARAALTEMRRLLGVLRSDAEGVPTRRPQPGLQQLNELLDETRDSSGVTARLIVRGRVRPLDPGIELTAYRIVQEALTNVRRHAPGAAVDVALHYAEEALRLTVRDNGPGPVAGGRTGHGLVGMRERVLMVGGELTAGPAPVSGFLVRATLPLPAVST
ncbi:sensor histidine kinase [Plantactinospora sonchi]|uniref:histidine kinase n=1 Tax=Plantactinospora sonchi TaxID=1544735 RepID=A0ABU7S171_9ACTN